jgi:hypothetical protein
VNCVSGFFILVCEAIDTAATNRPIVLAPGDYDDGEIGGMIRRGNRNTRRKPAPVPKERERDIETSGKVVKDTTFRVSKKERKKERENLYIRFRRFPGSARSSFW